MRQGLAADFVPETTQVSAALSYPGTIKAFHFHQHQTDLWVPSQGMFQVALVDLRPDSPTFGVKNTLYMGALKPWQILIPPGVGHGYKVIGEHAGMLVYVTNRLYNPAGRRPHPAQSDLHRLRLGTPAQMKFFVTGGAGFIGSAFVRLLLGSRQQRLRWS